MQLLCARFFILLRRARRTLGSGERGAARAGARGVGVVSAGQVQAVHQALHLPPLASMRLHPERSRMTVRRHRTSVLGPSRAGATVRPSWRQGVRGNGSAQEQT